MFKIGQKVKFGDKVAEVKENLGAGEYRIHVPGRTHQIVLEEYLSFARGRPRKYNKGEERVAA